MNKIFLACQGRIKYFLLSSLIGYSMLNTRRPGLNKFINFPKRLHCQESDEIVPFDHKRPFIGLSIRSMRPENGMLVVMVKSDSPGEKAGIKPKDIILEIDGKEISTINEYNAAVGERTGKKILKIQRGAEVLTIEVEYL